MKRVLITASYSPLGYAIAREFYSNGYEVFGTSTKDKSNEIIKTIKVDITDEDDINRSLSQIDKLDVLVNNAGIFTIKNPENLDSFNISSVFDVNVKGLMLVTKKLLPLLKESNGSIVNISSMNSIHPGFGGTSHYDASKGAVSAFTRSLACETGLRVNAIAPGLIERNEIIGSELAKKFEDHSIKGMLKVQEIAKSVFFLATSSGIYGQTLLQDNGYCLY